MSTTSWARPTMSRRTPAGTDAMFQVSRGRRSSGLARGEATLPAGGKALPRRNAAGSTRRLEVHRVRELRAHAAVDDERLARDVGGKVGAEEQQGGGDVGGEGDASQRRVGGVLLLAFLGNE